MARLYSKEVLICATAYVVAETEAEADDILNALHCEALEFPRREMQVAEGLDVSGERFTAMMSSPSLSPAMTLYTKPTPDLTIDRGVSYQEDIPDE